MDHGAQRRLLEGGRTDQEIREALHDRLMEPLPALDDVDLMAGASHRAGDGFRLCRVTVCDGDAARGRGTREDHPFFALLLGTPVNKLTRDRSAALETGFTR